MGHSSAVAGAPPLPLTVHPPPQPRGGGPPKTWTILGSGPDQPKTPRPRRELPRGPPWEAGARAGECQVPPLRSPRGIMVF